MTSLEYSKKRWRFSKLVELTGTCHNLKFPQLWNRFNQTLKVLMCILYDLAIEHLWTSVLVLKFPNLRNGITNIRLVLIKY